MSDWKNNPEINISQIRDILHRAKKTISTPDKWCKGSFARTSTGKGTSARMADACTFCLVGAIDHVTRPGVSWIAEELVREELIKLAIPSNDADEEGFICVSPAEYNDRATTTHEDVLKLLDHCIAVADKEIADGNARNAGEGQGTTGQTGFLDEGIPRA